ncbi:dihydrofolate reductase family protein [Kaarinaea lacus]
MKISVYIATSVDGFIARKNGDLDWLSEGSSEDDNEDYGYQVFFDSIDVLVMGRNTFEKVLSFEAWPYAGKKVIVLSNKELDIPGNIKESIEIKSCTPSELVKDLEFSGAEHLYIDGGKTIQAFLNANLIDEMTITRIPVIIGEGISLFGAVDHDIKLQHIETRQYPNGYVQSRYKVSRHSK